MIAPPLDSFRAAVTWSAIADLVLPATAIGVLGLLGLWATRRASAAARHLVALSALASLLALPLCRALPTPWTPWFLAAPLVPGTRALAEPPAPERWARVDASSPSGPAKPRETSAAKLGVVASPAPRSPWLPQEDLPAWLAAIALAGAASLLLRVALGLVAAAWAAGRTTPLADARWGRELEAARRRMGIVSEVRLATSPRLGVPVVSGLFRPTLVLPAEALQWTDERLRAVLLHELGHVRRGDAFSLMVGRLATALFWFHPLSWALARAMHREGERACDDVVLSSGVRASDYADHLLAIAREARSRRLPGLTLAFARASSLEGRLLALLRADLRRGPATARLRLATGALALLVVLPLSAIRVVGAAPPPRWSEHEPEDAAAPAAEPRAAEWRSETTRQETRTRQQTTEVARSDGPGLEALPAGESGAALYERAKALYEDRRWAEAGAAYEAAARGGHRPDAAWYNAACSYALDGQKLRALGALERAIAEGYEDLDHIQQDDDLDAIRSDGRYRLMIEGLRHSDAGERRRDDALRRYDALRGSAAGDASAWNAAGIELMRAGETDAAIEAFRRRVALDGGAAGIYNEACADALGGRTEAALGALERAIVAGYGDAEKLTSDADLAALRSERRFEDLVRLADDLSIHYPSGDQRDHGVWRDEMARLGSVARARSDLGRAWFDLGFVQLRAGEPAGARESFGRALEKSYRRPSTLYNLACAAAQMGDRDEAMRWLGQAETAGMDLRGYLKSDEDLDPLRSDGRFRAMLERLARTRDDHKDKTKRG